MLLIQEWILHLTCLLGLALAGGFILAPFGRRLPYLWLSAPLAGIGMMSVGLTAGFMIDLPLVWNLALNVLILSSLTLWTLFRLPQPTNILLPSLLILLFSGLCTVTIQDTTLRSRGPGVLLKDGTDSLGYAHVADWLRTHRWSEPPVADPSVPYQSWPAYGRSDHRPGAYLFLAALSWLRRESGLFTYDFASALVLCAGLLGFGGAFAHSRTGLLLLLAGATVSSLFDLSRSGYFGKILAYPSALLVASLFLHSLEDMNVKKLARIGALALGASLLQSGIPVALFLCLAWTGVPLGRVRHWLSRSKQTGFPESPTPAIGVSFMHLVVVAGLAAGSWLLVRGGLPNMPMNMVWGNVLLVGLDLKHHALFLPMRIPKAGLNVLLVGTLLVHLALAGVAIYRRNIVATGLLGGLFCFLLAALSLNLRWPFYQSLGALYLLAVAGAIRLWEDLPHSSMRIYRIGIPLLFVLLVGSRIPRFIVSANRYLGSRAFDTERYLKSDLDRIHTIIGKKTVDLRLPEAYPALAVLVELGRRDVKLQMDPDTWRVLVGYRRWPPPAVEKPGDLLLLPAKTTSPPGAKILFQNAQYILFGRPPI